jgi:hypothetical protein
MATATRKSNRITAPNKGNQMNSFTDPSTGKTTEPVTMITFRSPFNYSLLTYGGQGGKFRTFHAGQVDDRVLPLEPNWCDDIVTLSKATCAGRGMFIVPLSIAKKLLGYRTNRRFALPD